MSGFDKTTDERVSFLLKKYTRAPSTSTNIGTSKLESNVTASGSRVVYNEEIYSVALPSSLPGFDTTYTYISSSLVNKIYGGVVTDAIDISGSTVDLKTTYGLTEDIWQAFKDSKLSSVEGSVGNANIVKVNDLVTSWVADTASLEYSPSYYSSALIDCIPATIKGQIYRITIKGKNISNADVTLTSDLVGNWFIQQDCGVVQFFDQNASFTDDTDTEYTLFENTSLASSARLFNKVKTPIITFYKYIGEKGAQGLTGIPAQGGEGAIQYSDGSNVMTGGQNLVFLNDTLTVNTYKSSIDTRTGTLVIKGGVGIEENVNIGGTLSLNKIFTMRDLTTGSLTTLYTAVNQVGSHLLRLPNKSGTLSTLADLTPSSGNEGAVQLSDGNARFTSDENLNYLNDTLTISGHHVSRGTKTGTLVVKGGVGIEENIHVGGTITVNSIKIRDSGTYLGLKAGVNSSSELVVGVGDETGLESQGTGGVAVGALAGRLRQGEYGVSIGYGSGNLDQGQKTVAIGFAAGNLTQGEYSVGVGGRAGYDNQGTHSVAIGYDAGRVGQGSYSIALGDEASLINQGVGGVSIGFKAGKQDQADYAIAIGYKAGDGGSQTGRSIIINANENKLTDGGVSGLFIEPVREVVSSSDTLLAVYNKTTKEIGHLNSSLNDMNGTVTINGNYGSINTQTGTLVVKGGVGVEENINAGGTITGRVISDGSGYLTDGRLKRITDIEFQASLGTIKVKESGDSFVGNNLDIYGGNTTAGTGDIYGGNLVLGTGQGTGDKGGSITFRTSTPGVNGNTLLNPYSNKMVIKGDGKVGINTDNPDNRLTINAENIEGNGLRVYNSSSQGSGALVSIEGEAGKLGLTVTGDTSVKDLDAKSLTMNVNTTGGEIIKVFNNGTQTGSELVQITGTTDETALGIIKGNIYVTEGNIIIPLGYLRTDSLSVDSITIHNDLTVFGNLNVTGTTTTINSKVITVGDPIFTLGGSVTSNAGGTTNLPVVVGGGVYIVNGVSQRHIIMLRTSTYVFDLSDSSNLNHELRFSTNIDNTPGAAYTTGVSSSGTPGNPGASVTIVVAGDAPNNIYYYNTQQGSYGGIITIVDEGESVSVADLNLDRGIEYKYNDGAEKLGFFGFDTSESAFVFIPDGQNIGQQYSGERGNIKIGSVIGDTQLGAPTLTDNELSISQATITDLKLIEYKEDIDASITLLNSNSVGKKLVFTAGETEAGTDISGGDLMLRGGRSTGTGHGGDIVFQGSTASGVSSVIKNVSSTKMILKSTGNVGIGKTDPTSKLSIDSNKETGSGLEIINSTTQTSGDLVKITGVAGQTALNITAGNTKLNGTLSILDNSAVTNAFDGALRVKGGISSENKLYLGDLTGANGIMEDGVALIVKGGMSIGKNSIMGEELTITGTTRPNSLMEFMDADPVMKIQPEVVTANPDNTSISLFPEAHTVKLSSGSSAAEHLIYIGNNLTSTKIYLGGKNDLTDVAEIYAGKTQINNVTTSSSTNTGALTVRGGVGIEENLHLGGTMTIHSTELSTSTATGALKVLGGIGIQDNIHVGGTMTVDSVKIRDTETYLGLRAGTHSTGTSAVGIGREAGLIGQDNAAVAVGGFAGKLNQGNSGVAVGFGAGQNNQGIQSVAIGESAAWNNQSQLSVAIGVNAGGDNQGVGAIAIGKSAGSLNQPDFSIAIGHEAGISGSQTGKSIIINAFEHKLTDGGNDGLFVYPIRGEVVQNNTTLFYNTITKEISYYKVPGAVPAGVSGDVQLNDGLGDLGASSNLNYSNDTLTISSHHKSTDTRTGTLVVKGGVGIEENLNVGGTLSVGGNSIETSTPGNFNLLTNSHLTTINLGRDTTIINLPSKLISTNSITSSETITAPSYRISNNNLKSIIKGNTMQLLDNTMTLPHYSGTLATLEGPDKSVQFREDNKSKGVNDFIWQDGLKTLEITGSLQLGKPTTDAISIGQVAGFNNQGNSAIAIGVAAGLNNQGSRAIAIGQAAGTTKQADYAIAIGYSAGSVGQGSNSIVVNATSDTNITDNSLSGLFINPVRERNLIRISGITQGTYLKGKLVTQVVSLGIGRVRTLVSNGTTVDVEVTSGFFDTLNTINIHGYGDLGNPSSVTIIEPDKTLYYDTTSKEILYGDIIPQVTGYNGNIQYNNNGELGGSNNFNLINDSTVTIGGDSSITGTYTGKIWKIESKHNKTTGTIIKPNSSQITDQTLTLPITSGTIALADELLTVAGAEGDIQYNGGSNDLAASNSFNFDGNTLTLRIPTVSTGTGTGGIVLDGGMGIKENIYVGGKIVLSNNGGAKTTELSQDGSDNFRIKVSDSSQIRLETNNEVRVIIKGSGETSIKSLTSSTDTATGALTVEGGVGIRENLNVGGLGVINSNEPSSDTSTGALVVKGGVGIQESLNIGGQGIINSVEQSIDTDTGALVVKGGGAIKKNLMVGGIITALDYINGKYLLANTFAPSSNTTTGSLVVKGGAGIQENLHLGGTMTLHSTELSESTATGALKVKGGVGIQENLNVGAHGNVGGTLSSGEIKVFSNIEDGLTIRRKTADSSSKIKIIGDENKNNSHVSGVVFSNYNLSTGVTRDIGLVSANITNSVTNSGDLVFSTYGTTDIVASDRMKITHDGTISIVDGNHLYSCDTITGRYFRVKNDNKVVNTIRPHDGQTIDHTITLPDGSGVLALEDKLAVIESTDANESYLAMFDEATGRLQAKTHSSLIYDVNYQGLGIGTVPHSSTNVHIKHSSPQIRIEDSTADNYSKILQDDGTFILQVREGSDHGAIRFQGFGNGAQSDSWVYINNAGNVGIDNEDISEKLHIKGGNVLIDTTTGSSSTITGALVVNGGIGLEENIHVGGTMTVDSVKIRDSTTYLGLRAGIHSSNDLAVGIGLEAGLNSQGVGGTALGSLAGKLSQGFVGTAVGYNAGSESQGQKATAVGFSAGITTQGEFATAVGQEAGATSQGNNAVGVGSEAGKENQGSNAIAVGSEAGKENQGSNAISVGNNAGSLTQGLLCIAIGDSAGRKNQDTNSIAIGERAGDFSQGKNSVSLGQESGYNNQGNNCVAIGRLAGGVNQNHSAIAIGYSTGGESQSTKAIAIGYEAGKSNQGSSSIAIGDSAGFLNQPSNAIAIGKLAGGSDSQDASSIILNASGNLLGDGGNGGLFVDPVRILTGTNDTLLAVYDTITKEIGFLNSTLNDMNGTVTINGNYTSINTQTGTLVVKGGVGIEENVNIGGSLTVGDDLYITMNPAISTDPKFILGHKLLNNHTFLRLVALATQDAGIELYEKTANSPALYGFNVIYDGGSNEFKLISRNNATTNDRLTITRDTGIVTIPTNITSTTKETGSLLVSGGVGILENLNVGGSLTVGEDLYIDLSPAVTTDPKFVLGHKLLNSNTYLRLASNAGSNAGIEMFEQLTPGLGENKWGFSVIYAGGPNSFRIVSRNDTTGDENIRLSIPRDLGTVYIPTSVLSTGTATGALVVQQGGLGVKENISIGGALQWESGRVGDIRTLGSNSITLSANNTLKLKVNDNVEVLSTEPSINTSSGSLQVSGGVGIVESLHVGGTISVDEIKIGKSSLHFGKEAGILSSGLFQTGIGYRAGMESQGAGAQAFGSFAGKEFQSTNATAVGYAAGSSSQGNNAVAVGKQAGRDTQGSDSVAIGSNAGDTIQGTGSIAIGRDAGHTNQPDYAIAIGYKAGADNSQTGRSIILNANEHKLTDGGNAGLFINPVREISSGKLTGYDTSTKELGILNSINLDGTVTIDGNYPSINTQTGTLVVKGGVGIEENLNVGGDINLENGALIWPSTMGNIKTIGSSSIRFSTQDSLERFRIKSNGEAVFFSREPSTSTDTGALVVQGGLGIEENIHLGGSITMSSKRIHLGPNTSVTNPGDSIICIGDSAGSLTQDNRSIAIGKDTARKSQGPDSVAIGTRAGNNNQGNQSVAIGLWTGEFAQGNNTVAIGRQAAEYDQGHSAIAIGYLSGYQEQENNGIAIGKQAGQVNQGNSAIAIGVNSGSADQPAYAIAIGTKAGQNGNQSAQSIIINASNSILGDGGNIGLFIDPVRESANSKALFYNTSTNEITYDDATGGAAAGSNGDIQFNNGSNEFNASDKLNFLNDTLTLSSHHVSTGTKTGALVVKGGLGVEENIYAGGTITTHMVELSYDASFKTRYGSEAGAVNQGTLATAIGSNAGKINQGGLSVAVGMGSGGTNQGLQSVSIGVSAAQQDQGMGGIAIGFQAGNIDQGSMAIGIGHEGGFNNQGADSVAIGKSAGKTNQGAQSVAIGREAGETVQGIGGVAIGYLAGEASQPNYAIAIGHKAGDNGSQTGRSIILNANEHRLSDLGVSGLFINPVREISSGKLTAYDTSTKELGFLNSLNLVGTVTIDGNYPSTGTKTGSLVVKGGVGIEENLYVGGSVTLMNKGDVTLKLRADTDNFDESHKPTLVLEQDGGLISTTIGFQTTGGVSEQNNFEIAHKQDQSIQISTFDEFRMTINSSNTIIRQTTSSTDTETGALIVKGGVGIEENLNVGNSITLHKGKLINDVTSMSVITEGDTSLKLEGGNQLQLNTKGGTSVQPVISFNDTSSNGLVHMGYWTPDVLGGLTVNTKQRILSTTTSTNTNTGALEVDGGVAISDNLNVKGTISASRVVLHSSLNGTNYGFMTGVTNQQPLTTAIGGQAGEESQGIQAIAVGSRAGNNNQGMFSIAVGAEAGTSAQGTGATAVGYTAGQTNQGTRAVALGFRAGQTNQADYSVAIGYEAGYDGSQTGRSIIINANTTKLTDRGNDGLFINPIREVNKSVCLYYDTITKEVSYYNKPGATASAAGGANQIQYNDGASGLTASSNLTFNGQNLKLNGSITTDNSSLIIKKNGSFANPSLLVKTTGVSGADAFIKIEGARNASTSNIPTGIIFSNFDSNSPGTKELGMVSCIVTNHTDNYGKMQFSTYGTNNTRQERMSISHDGIVKVISNIGSSDYQTGSLVVTGGVGISEDLHVQGSITQTENNVRLCDGAGEQQEQHCIAIGYQTGNVSQEEYAIAIGYQAGRTTQGLRSIAIGPDTGEVTQGDNSIAIGSTSATSGQGNNSIAIGRLCGQTSQGTNAIALGYQAGNNTQGGSAVAIGRLAGQQDQPQNAVAIGNNAGGGTSQNAASIILNSTGVELGDGSNAGFFVDPIRDVAGTKKLVYNPVSKEISYQTDANAAVSGVDNNIQYNVGNNLQGSMNLNYDYDNGDGILIVGGFSDGDGINHPSTSTNTGRVRVFGGVGINHNLNVGGSISGTRLNIKIDGTKSTLINENNNLIIKNGSLTFSDSGAYADNTYITLDNDHLEITSAAHRLHLQGTQIRFKTDLGEMMRLRNHGELKLGYGDVFLPSTGTDTGCLVVQGGVGIQERLHVGGGATLSGHLMFSQNDTFDIGSADYKVRDLYVSDNSIWVGDQHKIAIHDGKMEFKKRDNGVIPKKLTDAGYNDSDDVYSFVNSVTGSSKSSLQEITLNDWLIYSKYALGDKNITVSTVFPVDNTEDYKEDIYLTKATINKQGSESNPLIYTVTVLPKSSTNVYSGGESVCYFIDGAENPPITLKGGVDSNKRTYYRFDQSNVSNTGYKLLFFKTVDKTGQLSDSVTTSGTAGQTGAYTEIIVDQSLPKFLFYQAESHNYLGNYAVNETSYIHNEQLNVEKQLYANSTEPCTGTASGSLIVKGGIGVQDDVHIGGSLVLPAKGNPTGNYSTLSVDNNGALTVAASGMGSHILLDSPNDINFDANQHVKIKSGGGAGGIPLIHFIDTSGGGETNMGLWGSDLINGLNIYTKQKIQSVVDSTNITSGALTVSGGAGIAKDVNIGGYTKIYSNEPSTSTSTGALIVNGGAGIEQELHVGSTITGELLRLEKNGKVVIKTDSSQTTDSTLTLPKTSGTIATLAGVHKQIQFNNNGVMAGDNNFTFDPATNKLVVTGSLHIVSDDNQGRLTIGSQAGLTNQGFLAFAIGWQAGNSNQGANATAMGNQAGKTDQGADAISIGYGAGYDSQGAGAIAIGHGAGGTNQAANSIAIGKNAGESDTQDASSIILNASGSTLGDNAESGLFVKPVRYAPNTNGRIMMYDTVTSEMTLQNKLIMNNDTLTINSTMPTISTHTGALVVKGGVGIVESLNIGGTLSVGDGVLRIDTTNSDAKFILGEVAVLPDTDTYMRLITKAGVGRETGLQLYEKENNNGKFWGFDIHYDANENDLEFVSRNDTSGDIDLRFGIDRDTGLTTVYQNLDVRGGEIDVYSTGDVTLKLRADTNNVGESNNPKIFLEQDGGSVYTNIGINSDNHFYLSHVNDYDIRLSTANAERVLINSTNTIIKQTTSSTTKDTGALIVEGGVGIEENVNIGGTLTTYGKMKIIVDHDSDDPGLVIRPATNLGRDSCMEIIGHRNASTSHIKASILLSNYDNDINKKRALAQLYVKVSQATANYGDFYIGTFGEALSQAVERFKINHEGIISMTNTTDASSGTTGALVLAGGLATPKQVYSESTITGESLRLENNGRTLIKANSIQTTDSTLTLPISSGTLALTSDTALSITLADETSDTTCFPTFSTAAAGDQALKTCSAFRWDSSNNRLGIGGTPSSNIHIKDTNPTMRFQDSDLSNVLTQLKQSGADFQIQLRDGSNNGVLKLQGYAGGSVQETWLYVDPNGFVGIGNSDDEPQERLHIASGNVLIDTFTGSNSTNTGALVINGGVGVEENINIGGYIRSEGALHLSTSDLSTYPISTPTTAGGRCSFRLDTGNLNEIPAFSGASASDLTKSMLGHNNFLRILPGNTSGVLSGLIFKSWYNTYSKVSSGVFNVCEADYFRAGLAFYTNSAADATTQATEKMRLSSSGVLTLHSTTSSTSKDTGALVVNGGVGVEEDLVVGSYIGIGNVNPDVPLRIKGGGTSAGDYQVLLENESYNKGIQFQYKSATGSTYDFPQAKIYTSGSSYDTKLHFSTANGTSNGDTALYHGLTIDPNQRIGIGTDSPNNKLQINHTAADYNDGLMIVRADAGTTIGELLGGVGFDSTDGNVPSKVQESSAAILAYASENHGTGNKGGHLTFWTKADTVNDDTNGTERMRITSAGYVGIGTTTPAFSCHIKTSIDWNGFVLTNGSDNIIGKLALDNVGVGGGYMKLYNAAGDSKARIGSDTTASYIQDSPFALGTLTPKNRLQVSHTGADGDDGIMIVREDTGTLANDLLGGIGFDSTDGNVPSRVQESSAAILAYASVNHGTTDKGGHLTFWTKADTVNDDTDGAERMRITSAGSVGIGTNAPATKLDVRGSVRIGDGATAEQDINFVSANGDWQVGTNNTGNGTNNNQFFVWDSAYRLTVQKGTGRVGIGTESPASILDVASTTSAFMPPRMTTTQRNLISAAEGMMIYNTTTDQHEGYMGSSWEAMKGGGSSGGNQVGNINVYWTGATTMKQYFKGGDISCGDSYNAGAPYVEDDTGAATRMWLRTRSTNFHMVFYSLIPYGMKATGYNIQMCVSSTGAAASNAIADVYVIIGGVGNSGVDVAGTGTNLTNSDQAFGTSSGDVTALTWDDSNPHKLIAIKVTSNSVFSMWKGGWVVYETV